MTHAFFAQLDEHRYLPTEHAVGPWSTDACHGGPPLALAAHELISTLVTPPFRLASMHLDLLGEVPVAPLAFVTKTIRDGRRVRLVATEATDPRGRTVLAARAWCMATSPNRAPGVATPLDIPHPDAGRPDDDIVSFPYGRAIEWRFVEGAFAVPGPAVVWAEPRIPLIDTSPLTPLQAALLVADSANGTSSVLDFRNYLFVPTTIDVQFHTAPSATRVGIASTTSIGGDGVGITQGLLFDTGGVYGALLQALYVEPRFTEDPPAGTSIRSTRP